MANEILTKHGFQLLFADHGTDFGAAPATAAPFRKAPRVTFLSELLSALFMIDSFSVLATPIPITVPIISAKNVYTRR